MSKTVALDSSVVAKLLLPEVDSDKVTDLIDQLSGAGGEAAILDIAIVEAANAIWKHFRRRPSGNADGLQSIDELLGLNLRQEPAVKYLTRAYEIAQRYDRAIYDALFVALADALGCEGVTADEPLYRAVQQDFPQIKLLRDWQ